MNNKERLQELIIARGKNLVTDIDKQKYETICQLMTDEDIFFKLKPVTALGILEFLGVQKEELKVFYTDLISPTNHSNHVRVVIPR